MKKHKLTPSLQKYLLLPSTIDFLNSTKKFISLLEDRAISPEDFYKKSHLYICELYLAGLKLELRYPEIDFDFDKSNLFENKNVGLISSLGDDGIYTDLFDPVYDQKGEPIQRWLDSDYSDIYQELKINIGKIYQIGTNEAIEDAFWEFKFGFIHSWGNHCVDAIRALHYLKYEGKPSA